MHTIKNKYVKVQDILNMCEEAAKVSLKLYEDSFNNYCENGQSSLLGAIAYFEKQHQLYRFEIPNIIKSVAEKHGFFNISDNDWISVNDKLPDKEDSYLVIGKSGGATVTRWYAPSQFHPKGHFGGNSSEYIKYWMPRPIAPGK